MPDITAITRDDIRLSFSCPESANVLDAAEEAGLYLPSVCRHGRCGTCRAKVVSGAYELTPHEAPLPPGPGGVLLCRCSPRENLLIELPCRDAQIGRRKVPERHAMIETVAPAAEGWLALSLLLQHEGEYSQAAEFQPGQYIELRIPGTDIWQSLSMANVPNDGGRLEFLFPLTPGEEIAAWAATARRGMRAEIRGPLGKFTLDETSPRPRCLVGAGAGLAPLLSMLCHLAGQRDRTRVHLIVEAAVAEIGFLERSLASLRAGLPQLTVALAPAGAPAALAAQLEKTSAPDIYAAGPPALLIAVREVASAQNIAAEHVHTAPAGCAADKAADALTGA